MNTKQKTRVKTLADLPALIDRSVDLQSLLSDTPAGKPLDFAGVWGGVRALLAAAIARHCGHVLVLLPQAADADIVAGDARSFGVEDVVALPLSAGDGSGESIKDADYAERLQVLQRLRTRSVETDSPLVMTAYVGGAMQRVPSPQRLASATRRIAVGDELPPEQLSRWLAEGGFVSTTAVQFPGEFAIRGGLLDIASPDQPHPIRIEWFGDEIESMRQFDLASQRSIRKVESIELAALGTKPDAADEPDAAASFGTITDYLPDDTTVLLVDPDDLRASAATLLERMPSTELFLNFSELVATFAQHRVITATSIGSGDDSIDLKTVSADSFAASLDETRAKVDLLASGHTVIVVGDTPADGQRLTDLMAETEAARSGRLAMTVADLSGGFRLASDDVLVLTGAELFHRSPVRRSTRRTRSKPIDSLVKLDVGDLVVHMSHGIGLYRGLTELDRNGQRVEHLVVEFDGGTKIYVPASRIGLVQRYVGGSKNRPRLAKIGGQSWNNRKQAVEAAVVDMAAELIEMQAERQAHRGIAFDRDNQWQRQFDASFPYTETDDQVTAIADLKSDMESDRPMDRLICGDVGFGKTEVAMRAAFKAVISGYQVAVLVPTTVLAEQHHNTFRKRMAEFPVNIAKMSRFCHPEDQRRTVGELKSGQVDIVIGTHRIAGRSIKFQRLGLVVVDEEQKFGVAVKERLKAKHTNVDVITLSATPIPRTLHMALVGARDISNLETPPAERLSVKTQVSRWDDTLIRSAVIRELNRGGQMFMVHNRIADIEEVAARVQRLVPELRIGIGHGRMDQNDLEQVMIDFIDHKFDMLIATTIIESGLDIPNANTIFIDDGNQYGLSDLHQLRGRVGRYKHQAYCYLLVAKNKHLTPEASKRLRAIEEYAQMGAGFAISMRDLEIRGAGNLLGSQQSGHIAAVGYEMYCQLLEDAVRESKNLPPRLTAEVDIDLPVEAQLGEDYVPDLRHKIDLYRRIAAITEAAEIQQVREELVDRFGPLPASAERMLELCELRLDAAAWQITSISSNEKFILLNYSDPGRMQQLVRQSSVKVRIVDDRKAAIATKAYNMSDPTGAAWLSLARSALWLG